MTAKVRIAHLTGPTATIQNTPPLVTSNKARARLGLPQYARNEIRTIASILARDKAAQ